VNKLLLAAPGVALLVLIAAFLVIRQGGPGAGHEGSLGPILPEAPSPPDRIELRNDSLDIRLALDGTVWWIEGPVRDRADSALVHDLIGMATTARALRLVAKGAESLSAFGLDAPRAELRLGDGPLLLVGKESEERDGFFAALAPGRRVVVAEKPIGPLADLRLRRLRDRTVLRFPPGEVNRFTINRASGTWTAGRIGQNRWTIGELGLRADARALAGIAALLSGSNVHSFQDSVPFDPGKKPLEFRVRWTDREAALEVGSPIPETALLQCRASDRPATLRIPRHVIDSLSARAERVLDLCLFETSPVVARSVSVRTDEASYELVREGEGGWTVRMGETLPAYPPRARAFLRNLENLRGVGAVASGGAAGWRAACRIVADGDGIEIGEAGDDLLARRLGESGFLRLPAASRSLLHPLGGDLLEPGERSGGAEPGSSAEPRSAHPEASISF
jgi:hypothetical protein